MPIVNHTRASSGKTIGICKAKGCLETIVVDDNESGFCRFCCNTNEAKVAAISLPPEPEWRTG